MAANSELMNRKGKMKMNLFRNVDDNEKENDENESLLTLSLSTTPSLSPAAASSALNRLSPLPNSNNNPDNPNPTRQKRARRNPSQAPRGEKSPRITPPYPWASEQRATVHSLSNLLSRNIKTIDGDVQCKRCERDYSISYDLEEKFNEIWLFIAQNKAQMHDRAPVIWMNPSFPTCRFCNQENSVKPVIADKKKSINWLFLLLGQMLGCCTLDQLKYFCKHTKNHRTGAKDRVLYLSYLGLCKQLNPNGPFDHNH